MIHSLPFNSAGWEWKSYRMLKNVSEHVQSIALRVGGVEEQLKSKRGRTYPLTSSMLWIINKLNDATSWYDNLEKTDKSDSYSKWLFHTKRQEGKVNKIVDLPFPR